MSWGFDDEEPQTWVPGAEEPYRVLRHVIDGGEMRAWNAQFERIIWKHVLTPVYGFPEAELDQWHDTAAEAACMALPRHLFSCAQALGVDAQKDMGGHNLMMRMCRPRSDKGGVLVWWDDPERIARLIEYCEQDVRVERAIYHKVRRMSKQERAVYLTDQRINDRGIKLDVPLREAAKKIVTKGLAQANELIGELTKGAVDAVTKPAQITRWLNYRGLELDNIQKSTVRELLEGDHDSDVQRVLELRSEAARSSNAKLKSMTAAACDDDRARGLQLYHGASTGRWTGKLIQPHNMPRGEIDGVEKYIPLILADDYEAIDAEHPPLIVVSSLLRGVFVPEEGHRFFVGDYNAIEARVLAWLAQQDDLVKAFAAGDPVYKRMAAMVFDKPVEEVTPEERTIGKVLVLGCGFGMGHVKFQGHILEQQGVAISQADAQKYVNVYRTANYKIKQLWKDLERACMRAVRNPGEMCVAGRIAYKVAGHYLWCKLPSDRMLCYSRPRIDTRETPWGEEKPAVTFMGMDSYTNKWRRGHLYGGLLAENVTQATARDLLAASMMRLERKGYPVVMTVHDEIISEVENGVGSLEEFNATMARKPRWADGCPVAVESWEGTRYRK
jgi:DNA polymerase